MSASKIKHIPKVILNLEPLNITDNKITKLLRQVIIPNCEQRGSYVIYYDNKIEVGMYRIDLIFEKTKFGEHIKDHGKFSIKIFERNRDCYQEITLKKDDRFIDCSWLSRNDNGQITIKILKEIILRCAELDRLKLFN
jgi:hypothetical protein